MGTMILLSDLIRQLSSLDENATIYVAEPWNSNSSAIAAVESEETGIPKDVALHKLKYFLEVFVAQEFLTDWESTLDHTPTDQERCTRLIDYAVKDA